MDAVLKALVAAACMCVIAASGHYGYSLYQQRIAEEQRVERITNDALRAEDEAKNKLIQERRERAEARIAKREAKKFAEAEIERKKQADRDNAASILKDAVINY